MLIKYERLECLNIASRLMPNSDISAIICVAKMLEDFVDGKHHQTPPTPSQDEAVQEAVTVKTTI